MTKRKRALLIFTAVVAALCICAVCLHMWYDSLKIAEKTYGGWIINGTQYVYADFNEISPYKETYNLICRSTDGNYDFYEIAEYPDHKYIVERIIYEAEVLKIK